MTLSEYEKQSAVWVKVSKYLTERLDTLRLQNDGDRTSIETARLRGRIAEIKTLLDIGPAGSHHDCKAVGGGCNAG